MKVSKKLLKEYSEFKQSKGLDGKVTVREARSLVAKMARMREEEEEIETDDIFADNEAIDDEVDAGAALTDASAALKGEGVPHGDSFGAILDGVKDLYDAEMDEVEGGEEPMEDEEGGDDFDLEESKKPTKAGFKKFVEEYRKYKFGKTKSRKISEKELASLKVKYLGSLKEAAKPKTAFAKLVEEYRAYKFKKTGSKKISEKEVASLKRKIKALQESKKPAKPAAKIEEKPTKAGFKKYVESYQQFKNKKKGVTKITEAEFTSLKKKYLAKFNGGSLATLLENYRKYKAQAGLDTTISYKEAKTLKEAFKRNPALKEATADFTADPAQDPAAMGAAPAAPAAPIDPALSASIQAAKTAVDQLASQAGIADVTDDLGADPNTGIAPEQAMDPNAAAGGAPAGAAPVAESVASIRARIAARSQRMNENLEGGLTSAPREVGQVVVPHLTAGSDKGNNNQSNPSPFENLPTEKQIAAGVDGGHGATVGATWPTVDRVPNEAALQGGGAKQVGGKESPVIKESIDESIESVNDRYLAKFFAPKLDYRQLSEALKSGRLG
jgi:hypothetical protein